MKQCTKCQQTKPFHDFRARSDKPDKLLSWCKVCISANARRWNNTSPEQRERESAERKEAKRCRMVEFHAERKEELVATRISLGAKNCSGCKELKPLSAFGQKRQSPDGLNWYCRNCVNTAAMKHGSSHREEIRVRNRANYAADPQRHIGYQKAYQHRNADKLKAQRALPENRAASDVRKKAWRIKNRERHLATERRYYAASVEKMRARKTEWRNANPEKRRAAMANCRTKRLCAVGTYTPEDIARIYKDQRGRCAYCRAKLNHKFHVDHIKPLARGGTNWPRNLQVTCASCNHHKHAADPIVHAQRSGLLI